MLEMLLCAGFSLEEEVWRAYMYHAGMEKLEYEVNGHV